MGTGALDSHVRGKRCDDLMKSKTSVVNKG